MARRTSQASLVMYVGGICCAMSALVQPAAGMAVTATSNDFGRHRQRYVDIRRPVTDRAVTRDKRWSTALGGATSIKNSAANNNNTMRVCNTDSDCLDTPYTSCAVDSGDRKRRCLCADGKQPLNGECSKKPRALKTSCETDVECLPNAVCKNNATATNSRLKICTCKDGFIEENNSCNSADLLTFNHAALLFAVMIPWIWSDR